jgi:glycosyltransferase involved in cell wall biosynthesis
MIRNDAGLSLVSAIIPTYNRSHLLCRAINSVLKQSYGDIEIIVVDDGSTDDTELVVAELGREANSIIYVKKNNGGCASARNKGLERANGRFIAFLDSDDVWMPNAIEILVSTLLESGAELVYSPSIEVHSNGKEEVNYPVAAGRPQDLAKEHFMRTNVRNGAYMFTRAALEKVGRLDENLKYNEDSDFFQRLAIQCNSTYSSSPTIRVYNHGGSKSRNRAELYKDLLISSQRILAKYPSFAEQLGTDADVRICQIRAQLVESLALGGKFAEANSAAEDIFSKLSLNVKIALLCRSNLLLKLEYFSRRSLRYLAKTIRSKSLWHEAG